MADAKKKAKAKPKPKAKKKAARKKTAKPKRKPLKSRKGIGGRPSPIDDPETVRLVIEAVKVGAPRKLAALYAGITEETVNAWVRRGDREKTGKFHEFSVCLKEAEGNAVVGAIAAIRKAGVMGKWQALAWWLERKYPDQFALRHAQQDGASVSIDIMIQQAMEANTAGRQKIIEGVAVTRRTELPTPFQGMLEAAEQIPEDGSGEEEEPVTKL